MLLSLILSIGTCIYPKRQLVPSVKNFSQRWLYNQTLQVGGVGGVLVAITLCSLSYLFILILYHVILGEAPLIRSKWFMLECLSE